MILEGTMISVAVICLTVLHPGLVFREAWHAADWTVRKKGIDADEKVDGHVSPPDYSNVEMGSVPYHNVRSAPADPAH